MVLVYIIIINYYFNLEKTHKTTGVQTLPFLWAICVARS